LNSILAFRVPQRHFSPGAGAFWVAARIASSVNVRIMPLNVIVKSLRIGSLCVSFQCDDGETTIVCGILLDAFRDLIDFHRLNAPLGEVFRALLPEIERLINVKHEAGWLERNGDLMIRTADLVRYGLEERPRSVA
jgi:hypothetical protein